MVIEGEDEFELINIYEGEENPFHAEHAIFRRSDFKEGYLHTCGENIAIVIIVITIII